MERYDVSESERFAEMVSAARSGVEVEITEGGAVVARVVPAALSDMATGAEFSAALREYWKHVPPELAGGNAAAEVRAMRDEGDH